MTPGGEMFANKIQAMAVLCLAPLLVSAAAQIESPMICSVARAVECADDLSCGPPVPQNVPPTFLHVDLDKRVVTLLGPEERRGETTQIRAVMREAGHIVLTGIEAGRAWGMVIAESDGSMSLTVTMERSSFVVFGSCIAQGQTSP